MKASSVYGGELISNPPAEGNTNRVSPPMKSEIHIGFKTQIKEFLPKSNFLFIGDEIPTISQRHRIFDPTQHSFNPLKNITADSAEALAEVLYTTTPGGENTLTVKNGKLALAQALVKASRFDEIKGDEEVSRMRDAILFTPLRRKVLCTPKNEFSFNPKSVVLARLNRKEIGDRNAFIIGQFLIAHYHGQIVCDDFGFYGRDVHLNLLREHRLIAAVTILSQLSDDLRDAVLLIKDKFPHGTIYDDAATLARYSGFIPGQEGHTTFVQKAMQ